MWGDWDGEWRALAALDAVVEREIGGPIRRADAALILVVSDAPEVDLRRRRARPRAVARDGDVDGGVRPLEAVELSPGDVDRSIERTRWTQVHVDRLVVGELPIPAAALAVAVPAGHLGQAAREPRLAAVRRSVREKCDRVRRGEVEGLAHEICGSVRAERDRGI